MGESDNKRLNKLTTKELVQKGINSDINKLETCSVVESKRFSISVLDGTSAHLVVEWFVKEFGDNIDELVIRMMKRSDGSVYHVVYTAYFTDSITNATAEVARFKKERIESKFKEDMSEVADKINSAEIVIPDMDLDDSGEGFNLLSEIERRAKELHDRFGDPDRVLMSKDVYDKLFLFTNQFLCNVIKGPYWELSVEVVDGEKQLLVTNSKLMSSTIDTRIVEANKQ